MHVSAPDESRAAARRIAAIRRPLDQHCQSRDNRGVRQDAGHLAEAHLQMRQFSNEERSGDLTERFLAVAAQVVDTGPLFPSVRHTYIGSARNAGPSRLSRA